MNSILIKRACPSCSASIEIYTGMTETHCPYCGCFLYIRDNQLLLRTAQEEFSTKTLTEKYNNLVSADEIRKRNEAERQKRKNELMQLGIDESNSRSPYLLDEFGRFLMAEATTLINENKWQEGKPYYCASDILETIDDKSVAGGRFSTLHLPFPYLFFKTQWPDNTVHMEIITPEKIIIHNKDGYNRWEGKKLQQERNKKMSEMNNLIIEINQRITRIRSRLFGSQRYVIFLGLNPYNIFVLFEDGCFFSRDLYQCFHFDRYESLTENEKRERLESLILQNIRRINAS